MERKRTTWLWLLVVVATFSLTATAFGGDAAKADGSKEGIKVHGHWKIEIFNPDGTRASTTEFDNDFNIYSGAAALSGILTRIKIPGPFMIRIFGLYADGPCPGYTPNGTDSCWIGEDATYEPYWEERLHSKNLTASTTSIDGVTSIILSGSVEASYPAFILKVYTYLFTKEATETRDWMTYWQFTYKDIASPLPSVVPGQTIQVTIEITFS